MHTRFRTYYLPELFVLLLGLALGVSLWMHIQQRQHISALKMVLAEQNEFLKRENGELLFDIEQEVKTEVRNEHKRTNEGLQDTLPMLLEAREKFIKNEKAGVNQLLDYQRLTGSMYNFVTGHSHEMQLSSSYLDSIPVLNDKEVLTSQLLQRERELLKLFDMRINGVIGCFGNDRPYPIAIPRKTIVLEGDTLKLSLRSLVSESKWFPLVKLPDLHPTFESACGKVVELPDFPHAVTLHISTAGTLNNGEAAATRTCPSTMKVPQPNGEFYAIDFEHTYTVVKRPD